MEISKFLKARYAEDVPYFISKSWDITDNENYWYRRGTTQFALVAHIDTLASKVRLHIDNLGFLKNKYGILGADDRAGCWIISQLLDLNPHILLFNYEESGGRGVKKFVLEHEIPKGIQYFLEFDRRGVNQFVYYSLDIPKKLVNWANMFGMTEEWGVFSDVDVLTQVSNIPHLNLSAGFIHEHTAREKIHLPSTSRIVQRYRKMLLTAPTRVPKFKERTTYIPYNSYGKYNNPSFYGNYGYDWRTSYGKRINT